MSPPAVILQGPTLPVGTGLPLLRRYRNCRSAGLLFLLRQKK